LPAPQYVAAKAGDHQPPQPIETGCMVAVGDQWGGRGRVMAKKRKLRWSDAPAAQDYPAAGSYLRLLARPGTVEALASVLSQVPTVTQAAKDILRAAGLPLLAVDDPEVAKDVKKIAKGQPLSPILLVRGDLAAGFPLQIADGYHRVCASYHLNEDTEIPCRIADIPAAAG
jgi:hypothetical protein